LSTGWRDQPEPLLACPSFLKRRWHVTSQRYLTAGSSAITKLRHTWL
jgi:hypothetical protein